MAITFTVATRNARASTLNTEIGANAVIRIYSGTPPASVTNALSSNTVLAELTGGSTFATISNGELIANAIAGDTSANATGTATFGRIFKSDGTTAVLQFSVGTSNSDLNLNSTAIQINAGVSISAFKITEA